MRFSIFKMLVMSGWLFLTGGTATMAAENTTMKTNPVSMTAMEKLNPPLPFAITVTEEKLDQVPDYMGPSNPVDMDFPFCPVEIDGEYWVIYKNGYHERVFRFKGTNIENAVRQPDGVATHQQFQGKGKYMLGGMWYNSAEKKLYAFMHCETRGYYSNRDYNNLREIHFATSTDKGLSWKYEGPIITRDDPTQPRPKGSDYSGLYWNGGNGDFSVCVDAREGYVYVYSTNYLWPKTGLKLPCSGDVLFRHQVARCAMSDKMAPGKWHKFYNGAWDEPGLGGKASYVNAYVVTYNDYLKKYLGFNYGGSLAVCTDLAKQDWSPSIVLKGGEWGHGDPYGKNGTFAWHVTDEDKKDIFTGGRTLYLYRYWQKQRGLASRIELGPGETPAMAGYFAEGGWGVINKTMDSRPLYAYEPQFESNDPIESRRTRRVDCESSETTYSAGWEKEANDLYYQRTARVASKAGCSIEFSFTGKDVYWRPFKGPDCGKADVFLDGKLQGTIDCYSEAATGYQFGFIKTGLDAKMPHVLKVVVRGDKNPLSTGVAVRHMLFEYAAESYRASDCFSSVDGKNLWWNLQSSEGASGALTYADPIWKGTDGCEIGYFHMIPGGSDAVRRWVAPRAGRIRVEGTVASTGKGSDGVWTSIQINGRTLWPRQLLKPGQQKSHDMEATVAAGDRIDFVIGRGGHDSDDRAEWDPTVFYIQTES